MVLNRCTRLQDSCTGFETKYLKFNLDLHYVICKAEMTICFDRKGLHAIYSILLFLKDCDIKLMLHSKYQVA